MLRGLAWVAVLAVQTLTLIWVVAFFAFGPGFLKAPSPAQIRELVSHGQVRVAKGADGALSGQCALPFFVGLDEVSPHVVNAAIATEDSRFYDHVGIDPRGLARALVANARGRNLQGGSTITQQLVKILMFEESDRRLRRKLLEVPVALRFEQALTKREILAAYLNQVYFAGGVFGIEGAARHFYGKTARDLNAFEAAVLVGMLKSPRDYSPTRNPEAAAARARVVLNRQVSVGMMSARDAERALRVGARPGRETPFELSCQHFRDWVVQATRGEATDKGRLRLVVTLDAWRQAELVYAADRAASQGRAQGAAEVAALDMSRQGEVRALVGGADYAASQFNRAVQARRSPGSLAKLALYAEACRQGWKPTDTLVDAPVTADGWPANFDGTYWGRVSLAESLVWSRNASAVFLEQRLAPARVAAMARRLGFADQVPAGRGVSLGAFGTTLLDVTAAYATLANSGRRVKPHGVVGIIGPSGTILKWREPETGQRLLSEACATTLQGLLRQAVREGTGRAARFDAVVAGKTGTSNDFRDAWFVGFSGDTVAGFWVGNDDSSPMRQVSGAGIPAAAFRLYASGVVYSPGAPSVSTAPKGSRQPAAPRTSQLRPGREL